MFLKISSYSFDDKAVISTNLAASWSILQAFLFVIFNNYRDSSSYTVCSLWDIPSNKYCKGFPGRFFDLP